MFDFCKKWKSRNTVKLSSDSYQRPTKFRLSPLFWIQKRMKKKKKKEDIFTVESCFKSMCESVFDLNSLHMTEESVFSVSCMIPDDWDKLMSTVPIEDNVLPFSKMQEEQYSFENKVEETKLGSTMPGKAEKEKNMHHFSTTLKSDVSALQLRDKTMTMLILEELRRVKEAENYEIGNTISFLADQREENVDHNLYLQTILKRETDKHKSQVEVNEMNTVIAGDGLNNWHDPNYPKNNRENDLVPNADQLELLSGPFLSPSKIEYIHMTPIQKYEQQEMDDNNAAVELITAKDNSGLCGMDSSVTGIMLLTDPSGLGESSRRDLTEDELNPADEVEEHSISSIVDTSDKNLTDEKSCDKVSSPDMITPFSLCGCSLCETNPVISDPQKTLDCIIQTNHNEQHQQIGAPTGLSSDHYLQEKEFICVTSNTELTNYNQPGKVECTKKLMRKKFSPRSEKDSKSTPKKKKSVIRWKIYLRYRLCCLKRKRNCDQRQIKYNETVASGKKVCGIDDQTDSCINLKVHLPVQSSKVSQNLHQFDFLNQVIQIKTNKARAATVEAKSSEEMLIGAFLKSLVSTWCMIPNISNGLQTVILLPAGLQLYFEKLLQGPPPEERERMSYEWLRLYSFINYPTYASGSRIRLAQAGFYYSGNGRLTTCYACDVQHSEWNFNDDPYKIHRRISPHCPFLRGNPAYPNVPIISEREENTIPVGNNARHPLSSHSTDLTMFSSQANLNRAPELSPSSTSELKTCPVTLFEEHAPIETIPQAQSSQEKGPDQEAAEQTLSQVENPSSIGTPSINPASTVDFDHTPSVIDQPIEPTSNVVFNTSSGESREEQSPSAEATTQTQTQRPTVDVENPQYINLDKLGEIFPASPVQNLELDPSPSRSSEHARYPDYALLSARIASYTGWLHHHDQSPQQLAEAGFFYTGQADYTCCFHCGGGLWEWNRGDNPWIEHAKFYHHCAYLLWKKGQKFVNAVIKEQAELLETQNSEHNYSQKTTIPRPSAACNADSQSEQQALKTDQLEASMEHLIGLLIAGNKTIARTVRNNDDRIEELRQEINQLKQNYSSPLVLSTMTTKTTTTHASYTVHQPNQIAGGRSHGQQISHSRQHCGNNSQVSDQTTLNPSRAHSQQNMSDPISICPGIPPLFLPLGNQESCQSNMLTVANSQQSSQQLVVEHLPTQDTPSVREYYRQSGEQNVCKICMERIVELAFTPCGHAVSCSECGNALQLCPICRAKIQYSVRIYLG